MVFLYTYCLSLFEVSFAVNGIILFIGGVVVSTNDPSCTHIVVEDGQTVYSSDYRRDDKQIYIVKSEVLAS